MKIGSIYLTAEGTEKAQHEAVFSGKITEKKITNNFDILRELCEFSAFSAVNIFLPGDLVHFHLFWLGLCWHIEGAKFGVAVFPVFPDIQYYILKSIIGDTCVKRVSQTGALWSE